MNLPDVILQSLASAPGLLAAVIIVWLYAKQEETRQNREDKRDARRFEHEKALAARYETAQRAQLEAIDKMADRIETSHRDIFHRQARD